MHGDVLIREILTDYQLLSVYGGHRLHGDHPLLTLNGSVAVNRLLESEHFRYAGEIHGELLELWAGEVVQFTTTEGEVTLITAPDSVLEGLVTTHLTLAVRAIRRALMLDFADEDPNAVLPIERVWQETMTREMGWEEAFEAMENDEALHRDLHPVSLPAMELRDLSRAERLDRARALSGLNVRDALDHREAEQRNEAQLLFALTNNIEPETEVSYDEWIAELDEHAAMENFVAPFIAEGGPNWNDDSRY